MLGFSTHWVRSSGASSRFKSPRIRCADYAFEAVGYPALVEQAFFSVRLTGTGVFVGIPLQARLSRWTVGILFTIECGWVVFMGQVVPGLNFPGFSTCTNRAETSWMSSLHAPVN